MALVIKEDVSGAYVPVVVCDVCFEQIAEASQGNYWFRIDVGDGKPTSPIYFAHRQCSQSLEDDKEGDGLMLLEMLSELPLLLSKSLKMNYTMPEDGNDEWKDR